MALRLHRAAHHAKRHLRSAIGVHRKGRNDGVRRTLARPHLIGVARLQGEARATVLQADARARYHHARTKAHVVGLDERDHHAAFIRRRQIHRAAALGRAIGRVARVLHVDELGTLAQVVAVQQLFLRLDAHVIHVGVVLVQIGQRQLHRLDLQMHRVGAVERLAPDVQLVQHAQRHQRGDALAVGRNLVDHRIAEWLRHRAHPVRLVCGQIVHRHRATIGLRMRCHLLCQFAAIKGFAMRRRDQLQRARMCLAFEHLACTHRAAIWHEAFGKTRLLAQLLRAQLPQRGDHRRHRKAVACVVDGRLRHLFERQLAKALAQRHPCRHRARHRHRVPALFGNAAKLLEVVRRPGGGRAA
ncbi:hypothetical protein SDC9_74989 [bioreactor metagenome]|uniref:Uncharacterized protein n=1 Tax=bioreactor metagenome TaxID=1076179 RepID=A0A644YPP5_9ZZZZ